MTSPSADLPVLASFTPLLANDDSKGPEEPKEEAKYSPEGQYMPPPFVPPQSDHHQLVAFHDYNTAAPILEPRATPSKSPSPISLGQQPLTPAVLTKGFVEYLKDVKMTPRSIAIASFKRLQRLAIVNGHGEKGANFFNPRFYSACDASECYNRMLETVDEFMANRTDDQDEKDEDEVLVVLPSIGIVSNSGKSEVEELGSGMLLVYDAGTGLISPVIPVTNGVVGDILPTLIQLYSTIGSLSGSKRVCDLLRHHD